MNHEDQQEVEWRSHYFLPGFFAVFFFSGVHGPPWSIGHLIHHNPLVTSGYVLVDQFPVLETSPCFQAAPGDGHGDASSSSFGKGRPANNQAATGLQGLDPDLSTTSSGSQKICGKIFQVQLAVSVLGGVPGVRA